MGANTTDQHAEERLVKTRLVLYTIAKQCATSSDGLFHQINHAINELGDGSKLEVTVLSGGYTNYSYKVFVDKHPELCIFAKLCFEYPLWNPDSKFDLKRTENEYEMLKIISSKSPDTVASPIACWGIEHEGQNMKLLVTEWSRGDEQLCNQFIDGSVDERIAPKLADTLAALHNIKDFDPHFNEQVKDTMENMVQGRIKDAVLDAIKSEYPKDRTEAYCKNISEDAINMMTIEMISNFRKRDCLMHGDSHVFNTLVEAKPSAVFEEFGPNGTMVLCDWEMCQPGPIGNDIGSAISFPIGCMFAHALNGHVDAHDSIKHYIKTLLDTYLSRMEEAGKTPSELTDILRNIMSICGWFSYGAFYVEHIMMEFFPAETDKDREYVHDALGIFGLKLIRLCHDAENFEAVAKNSKDIRSIFTSLLEAEVSRANHVFTSKNHKARPRRSSLLRASNRRLSDAGMLILDTETMKRLSIVEAPETLKRFSIAEGVSNDELLQ